MVHARTRPDISRAIATFALVLALGPSVPCRAQTASGAATAEPRTEEPEHPGAPPYELMPVVDTALMSMAFGFAVFSELAIQSGELEAQAPAGVDKLLFIDRWVAERDEIEGGSALLSTLSVALIGTYAAVDTVLSATVRETGENPFTQAALYVQVALMNWAAGNMTKLAVRRPRPSAYYEARTVSMPDKGTDSSLSFYSLHSAMAAGLAATASYFAWDRDPGSLEAWLTIGLGTLATAYTGYERVRALAHFPTDVLAGILFGAGIGVLVPELHRADGPIQVSPMTDGSTSLGLQGLHRF